MEERRATKGNERRRPAVWSPEATEEYPKDRWPLVVGRPAPTFGGRRRRRARPLPVLAREGAKRFTGIKRVRFNKYFFNFKN